MTLSKRQGDIIDRFLDGDLSGIELEQFRKELDDNPAMQAELKLQQKINDALKEKDIIEFRQQLTEIQQEVVPYSKPVTVRNYSYKKIMGMAASLIVLLTIAFTVKYLTGVNSTEKVFTKYYQRYEPLNFRSGSDEIDLLYRNGLIAYQNEDFEKARNYFEQVLKIDGSRMEANLLNGASDMELEKYKAASNSFQKVIDQKDNLFIEDAEWYLGLCYLKTKETQKAIGQFSKIANGNSIKKEEARKILKKIE